MARKWSNSKGIGIDYDRRIEMSLDKLRRELMKPEVYNQKHRRQNKKNNRKRSR